MEGIEHARLLLDDLEQAVVGDDDERVDLLGQQIDALLGLVAAQAAFEAERLGDDAHGERADFLARDLGHDRSRSRARAAAFACGDEDHVGLGQRVADLCAAFLGSLRAHLGVRAGAQTTGEFLADVDGLVGIRHEQRLAIGVHGDELDALDAGLHHAVDRVRAAAAHTDDLDNRQMLGSEIDRHVSSSYRLVPFMLHFP